jgi:hypothetical protein
LNSRPLSLNTLKPTSRKYHVSVSRDERAQNAPHDVHSNW